MKYTWKEALIAAKEKLEEGEWLFDGENKWDIDNLFEYSEGVDGFYVDEDNYYCVGWDGSIGFTKDNGYNVVWLYSVIK